MRPSRNILLGSLIAIVLIPTAYAQPKRPFPGGLRTPDKLNEGDAAPDFTLKMMKGEKDESVTLSDYQGDRPVALVFGSYT